MFTRWRDKSVGDFGRSGSGSGGLPAGIEDLELSFRVRAGRSSASSSPAEGAGGGGGEEERWREGEEGGVEERTGWEADLVCKGWRREVDKEGFGGLAGEVGRDKGDNGGGACSGIVWFTTPPPTPPRPSSLGGIELLEPCSDLKIAVFLFASRLIGFTCNLLAPSWIPVIVSFQACLEYHCQLCNILC